jgi:O-antigen/teichoic acid export membrane protein
MPRASLAGSIVYLGGVNIVAFGAGIIRQKVFAIFLAPAGLGAFSMAASFFELFTTVARLGTPAGLLRELTVSLRDEDLGGAGRVFLDIRKIVLVLTLALGVAVTLMAPGIRRRLFAGALPWWTVPALAVAAPVSLAGQLCESAINALGRVRTLALSNVTTVLLGLPVAVWLVATYELTGAILQLVAGAFIALLVSQGFLSRIFRPREYSPERVPRRDALRSVAGALRTGIGLTLHQVAVAANLFFFRSVIVAQLGAISGGYYQGTMALSRQYTIALQGGIFVYLYPRLVERARNRESFAGELSRGLGFALALIVPVVLTLLTTRDWIVRIVFSEEFTPIVPLMTYSLTGDVFAVLVEILRMALLASGSATLYAILGVFAEGLYLVAFVGGLRLFSLTGAVGAYPFAGVIALFLYGVVLFRRRELEITPRLALQLMFAMTIIGAAGLGAWTSWELALGLALVWIGCWRREFLAGIRK